VIERAAPEPMAAYVVGVQCMDPAGMTTFYVCLFANTMEHAARLLAGFKLADGYTVRDAFIAPSPVRIPVADARAMGVVPWHPPMRL
jgi:hypothetical protein